MGIISYPVVFGLRQSGVFNFEGRRGISACYFSRRRKIEPDENDTVAEFCETLRSIANTTFKDTGKLRRGVYAKTHGLISAELAAMGGVEPLLQ